MNEVGLSFVSLILIGAGIGVIFLLVLIFSLRRNPAHRVESASTDSGSDHAPGNDPTPLVAPMTGLSRSPHDRHRDLTVAKAILKRLDQLDAMIADAAKRNDELAGPLELFRDELTSLLHECEVETFQYDAGTPVNAEMRSRIQVVGGESKDAPGRIAETVRCGFHYLPGEEEPEILRKAEVILG